MAQILATRRAKDEHPIPGDWKTEVEGGVLDIDRELLGSIFNYSLRRRFIQCGDNRLGPGAHALRKLETAAGQHIGHRQRPRRDIPRERRFADAACDAPRTVIVARVRRRMASRLARPLRNSATESRTPSSAARVVLHRD